MQWIPQISLFSMGLATSAMTAIATAIDSTEILATRALFHPDGLFSIALTREPAPSKPSTRALDWLLAHPRFLLYPSITLVCAGALLSGQTHPGFWLAALIAGRLAQRRLTLRLGNEGADRILTILLVCMACFYLLPLKLVQQSVPFFLAWLTILAYTTSGVAKVLNSEWRKGRLLALVLSTEIFACPPLARRLREHPQLTLLVTWGVLIYECGCPVWVLASPSSCVLFILLGVGFHLFIAITQGLNLFFWVYLATYPSLLWFSEQLHRI